ncbi:transmembrane protein 271-like [Tachysurus fulvidraco]|uniref:transmembrane protein 271-like n=1 Tax=Tachysurus fulvidraco TaxID=1234273 RepID=UPI000F5054B9|nr:transmembrane protein 271-like [Tachysurus fulvidraco]
MKLSGKGACAVVSSSLLFACAVSAAVVGFECLSLGAKVKAHFQLSAAAGAFYSGILLGLGQSLLAIALLCCRGKAACRNFFLFGLLVFLLGVLTAFSGAVVDGDAVSLVERKYSRYCLDTLDVPAACGRLKDYQRGLVASTVLNALECLIGLVNLVVIKRYQAAQVYRRRRAHRRSAREVLLVEERELTVAANFRSVSYISLAACGSQAREDGAEARKSGHPSIELPGYVPSQNVLHHVYGFSYPPANDSPPAYEDIFPGERRNKAFEC